MRENARSIGLPFRSERVLLRTAVCGLWCCWNDHRVVPEVDRGVCWRRCDPDCSVLIVWEMAFEATAILEALARTRGSLRGNGCSPNLETRYIR